MKQIFRDFKYSLKSVDKLVLVFVLVQYTCAVGFIPPIPEIIRYMILVIIGGYTLIKAKTVSSIMMILVVYLALNIFICAPDSIFNSWMRLGLFVILLISVSPLFQSKELCRIRKEMLNMVLWIAAILSVSSFFCRFLGINFMWRMNSDFNIAGTFAGLFNQSMILGPLAGISTIFMVYKAYYAESRNSRNWYILFAIACFAAVLFSASRSALLSTMVGICFMFMKVTHGGGKFFKLASSVLLIAAITFPIWGNFADAIIEKNETNVLAGSFMSSRESKWNARMEEFKSSPIFGIGFSSVEPSLDDVGRGGVIEPGSSWLAVLSMTGVVGGMIFLIVFFQAYLTCNRMSEKDDALLLGLLMLFGTHMFAEGYVFAAGGFLCFLLWLVIGCCIDRKFCNNNK